MQYLDKRLFVQLNGSRKVIGVLRGYDVFLNIVLDDAVEEKDGGEKVKLGMVARCPTVSDEDENVNFKLGDPRKFGRHAGSTRTNRRRRQTGLNIRAWAAGKTKKMSAFLCLGLEVGCLAFPGGRQQQIIGMIPELHYLPLSHVFSSKPSIIRLPYASTHPRIPPVMTCDSISPPTSSM